jgi:hypothetical protein
MMPKSVYESSVFRITHASLSDAKFKFALLPIEHVPLAFGGTCCIGSSANLKKRCKKNRPSH